MRHIHFRASPHHEAKLQSMADALGTTPSAVLRELVENAELKPVNFSPVAILQDKNNSRNAQVLTGQSAAAVLA